MSPSGSQVDHNYATVAVYSSFEAMENPYPNELLAKIVPAQSMPEFTRKTFRGSRTCALRDVGSTGRHYPETPLAKPAPFLSVESSKVPSGGDANYLETEKVWKKLHDVRIKEEDTPQLGRLRPRPAGRNAGRSYATASGYGHFKDLMGLDFAGIVQKAGIGMSVNELGDRTAKARDLVRGEVRVLVDYVQAPPK